MQCDFGKSFRNPQLNVCNKLLDFVCRCRYRPSCGRVERLRPDPSAEDEHELVRLRQGHADLGQEAGKGNGHRKNAGMY